MADWRYIGIHFPDTNLRGVSSKVTPPSVIAVLNVSRLARASATKQKQHRAVAAATAAAAAAKAHGTLVDVAAASYQPYTA